MTTTTRLGLSLVVLSFVATAFGCSDPADVAGDYTVALTNRENGCNFDNWTVGNTSSNIPVTITQEGSSMSATVGGGAAVVLDLALGGHVYQGDVDGSHLTATIYGNRSATNGNCTFTYNSTFDADSDGDFLTGEIRYTPATNGNPDCATIEGCVNRQEFNGSRPPQ